MNSSVIILIVSTFLFYVVGGCVDYWQSAKHHRKLIPKFLKNYFALFWLILYSGVLPFLMVYSASNFNRQTAKMFIGAVLIGTSLWDFVYARLDKKKFVYNIKDYWFWGRKNYSLTKNQLILWHLARIVSGLTLLTY